MVTRRLKIDVTNYTVVIDDTTSLEVQAPTRQATFKEQLDAYVLRVIFNNPDFSDISKSQKVLQDALGKIDGTAPEFIGCSFEKDQEVIELMILPLICELVTKNAASDYVLLPCWQKSGQGSVVKRIYRSNKASWDGYLLPVKNDQALRPIAIELKTLGSDPNTATISTIEDQAHGLITRKASKLATGDTLNVILAYPNDPKMTVDVKDISEKLIQVMDNSAMGIVCMLDLPDDKQLRITAMMTNKVINEGSDRGERPDSNVVARITFGKTS